MLLNINPAHLPHVFLGAAQWLAEGSLDGSFAAPAVAVSEHQNLRKTVALIEVLFLAILHQTTEI